MWLKFSKFMKSIWDLRKTIFFGLSILIFSPIIAVIILECGLVIFIILFYFGVAVWYGWAWMLAIGFVVFLYRRFPKFATMFNECLKVCFYIFKKIIHFILVFLFASFAFLILGYGIYGIVNIVRSAETISIIKILNVPIFSHEFCGYICLGLIIFFFLLCFSEIARLIDKIQRWASEECYEKRQREEILAIEESAEGILNEIIESKVKNRVKKFTDFYMEKHTDSAFTREYIENIMTRYIKNHYIRNPEERKKWRAINK